MNIFKKKIFSFSSPPFGLEISDDSIRMIQLDFDGGEEVLRSFSQVSIPHGVVVDGEIMDKSALGRAISDGLKKAKPRTFGGHSVICSLPESKAFLRIISIPKMDERELGETIKWELEANIPMAIDQVYYDWQLIDDELMNGDQKRMNILVVAVARSVVDNMVEVLGKSGLTLVALETESIAQSRSLIDSKSKGKTSIVVDISRRRTSFLISVGSTPCFTSSIPVSIQTIISNISKSFGVDAEESAKILAAYGIGSIVSQDAVFRALSPLMEELVSEIRRSIDFYVSDLKYSKSVDEVVLIGRGALLRGMSPFLSKELEMKVKVGNPWINVNTGNKIPAIDFNESVEHGTSIGLGLRGLRQDK